MIYIMYLHVNMECINFESHMLYRADSSSKDLSYVHNYYMLNGTYVHGMMSIIGSGHAQEFKKGWWLLANNHDSSSAGS